MKPRSALVFIWVGAVLWLLVTVGVLIVVIQSPDEHSGLALGLFLIWVALIAFVAFARVTDYLGRRLR
jgi:hypothetical protein